MPDRYYEPVRFVGDPVQLVLSNACFKLGCHELRKSKHLTQQQMANATNLSTQCISDIESVGKGNPTLSSIIRYLNCLGIELTFRKMD